MTGIIPFGLAGNWCSECGRPKWMRQFLAGTVTGCQECDAVTIRHRCVNRPDADDMDDGESWTCCDCGSTWTAAAVTEACEDCCGECGHEVQVRRWSVAEGDRVETAPKFTAPGWVPMRNVFARPSVQRGPAGPRECHVTRSGVSVHVKPGCRCRRQGR